MNCQKALCSYLDGHVVVGCPVEVVIGPLLESVFTKTTRGSEIVETRFRV